MNTQPTRRGTPRAAIYAMVVITTVALTLGVLWALSTRAPKRPGTASPAATSPTTSSVAPGSGQHSDDSRGDGHRNGDGHSHEGTDPEGVVIAPSTTPIPAARQNAEAYARAWARPDLTREAWWAQISPYATPEHAASLKTTNPANLPARTVTGAATPRTTTTLTQTYAVPMDNGTLVVTCMLYHGRWQVSTVERERPQ